jgi:hypothetical protein
LAYIESYVIFTTKIKTMDKEAQKQRVQLLDELMIIVQVMDELYQYHPENPK